MASMLRKAMYYLGLTEEQDLPREAAPEPVMEAVPSNGTVRVDSGASAVPGRRIDPPSNRAWSPTTAAAEEARLSELGSTVRAVAAQDTHAEVVVAEEFEDAKRMADYLRDRLPVVLDLRSAGPDTVRRLVDFSSGITYALDGSMTKINTGVILVSPPRVTISREERRRLADLGLYALDEIS